MAAASHKIFSALILLAVAGLLFPARAAVNDLSAFARLPVQEGGRVMPMDTYARLNLLQLSGHSSFARKPAIDWLARLLFEPEKAHDDKVFLVNHPEVLEAMGVDELDGRRFSFHQLEGGLNKLRDLAQAASQREEKDRSAVEKEFVRLYQSITTYLSLNYSFVFAVPHPDFSVSSEALRQRMQPPAGVTNLTFLDVFLRAPLFAAEVQGLASTDSTSWTDEQAEAFRLSSALFQWNQYYRDLPISLLPLGGHAGTSWLSPWDAMSVGAPGEPLRGDLIALQELARAYAESRQTDFNDAAGRFESSVLARAPASRSLRHLDLELLYNRLDPFYRAQLFYGFSFLICLAGLMSNSRIPGRIALAAVALAFIPHCFGLICRMIIMGRPPMTNLYATFLFVAWMCVALGFFVEALQRNSLGTLLASISGLVFLMIAGRFSTQGDTLGVVVAVLDSNFWLATHVVTITMGYAGCLAAGVVGHLYLLQAARWPENDARLTSISRAIYGLLAFGLIFSFLGTMLGGVWADQSWGRFWGWDPKENGALLIVIWCAILFHARVAGMIGPVGVAAGSVLGVIVVLMAWLGINLLGVGLHSYGFTSGLARGLWISVSIEIAFVAATLWWIQSERVRRTAAR